MEIVVKRTSLAIVVKDDQASKLLLVEYFVRASVNFLSVLDARTSLAPVTLHLDNLQHFYGRRTHIKCNIALWSLFPFDLISNRPSDSRKAWSVARMYKPVLEASLA